MDARPGATALLKIIAGEYRSRQLASPPDGETSRPYAHRVREAVFNLLRGWWEDARVLDLFAGVGTVGLEAASRGAGEVVMVERDRRIFRLLEKNIAALACGDRVTAVMADALGPGALLRAPSPIDLVFVDPPYAFMREEASRSRVFEQMTRCAAIMAEPSFLVLRSPLGPDDLDLDVPGLLGPETHRFGPGMWVLLYQPGDATGSDGDD